MRDRDAYHTCVALHRKRGVDVSNDFELHQKHEHEQNETSTRARDEQENKSQLRQSSILLNRTDRVTI